MYQRLVSADFDPEVLSRLVNGSDMRHRLMPGGTPTVKVQKAELPGATLLRGRYGMGILVSGAWPADLVTLGLVLDSPDDVVVNGFVCPPLSVQLYSEGAELSYRATAGSTWFAYCIDREQIQDAAHRLGGRPLPIPQTGSISFQLEARAGQRIATAIQALLAGADGLVPLEATESLEAALQERLQWALVNAFDQGVRQPAMRDLKLAEQRRRFVARAEDYLRATLSEPFSLGGLATAVGASSRMLEYYFRRTYGVAPQTWHRSMKLDAVRRDLQQARRTGMCISEIAMRRGFLHLGRFSGEYRRLFGESPRDTMRRA